MEDAMVINRGSLQRGFAHGQVYTSKIIDLKELKKGTSVSSFFFFFSFFFVFQLISLNWLKEFFFKRDPAKTDLKEFLDEDGLPYPGTFLRESDPYYW